MTHAPCALPAKRTAHHRVGYAFAHQHGNLDDLLARDEHLRDKGVISVDICQISYVVSAFSTA